MSNKFGNDWSYSKDMATVLTNPRWSSRHIEFWFDIYLVIGQITQLFSPIIFLNALILIYESSFPFLSHIFTTCKQVQL